MILGGSCYAELPISSTHQMFQTYNGEVYDIDSCFDRELDIDLNIKDLNNNMVIINIDLNIKQIVANSI
jgi:hypothetical protein